MRNRYGYEYGIDKITTTYGNGQQNCKFAVTITGPDIAYHSSKRKRNVEVFDTLEQAKQCYNGLISRMEVNQIIERVL